MGITSPSSGVSDRTAARGKEEKRRRVEDCAHLFSWSSLPPSRLQTKAGGGDMVSFSYTSKPPRLTARFTKLVAPPLREPPLSKKQRASRIARRLRGRKRDTCAIHGVAQTPCVCVASEEDFGQSGFECQCRDAVPPELVGSKEGSTQQTIATMPMDPMDRAKGEGWSMVTTSEQVNWDLLGCEMASVFSFLLSTKDSSMSDDGHAT